MRTTAGKSLATALTLAAIALMASAPARALTPKEARDQLDLLATVDPSLRVVEVNVDAASHSGPLPGSQAMEDFRAEHGEAWRFTIDLRRGVTSLLDGGAIPFIPGAANDLAWEDVAPGCSSYECLPVATVEVLARNFIAANAEALGLDPSSLVLDPAGSGPFSDHLYFLRFDWTVGGLPVERASVYVRINSGNLIQLATERIGTAWLDVQPTLGVADAAAILEDYLGPFGGSDDVIVDAGSLRIVPVTPAGQDPDHFEGPIGSGIDYRLAWRFAFTRAGVIGTWEGLVDAHTGELLRFVDTNRYGRIHGGAYPGDNHTGEADRPFPFADTGLPAPNQYANSGGLFPGDTATTHLLGKYARLHDSCGTISNTTTTGDVDFSLGSGTDCAVPPGNTGGPGNTHSARTQYYHLTSANLRAQAWLPGNTWLQNNYITVYTNQSPWCNATSGGDSLNFYRSDSGCWNLGEIPGVALHEWGHSLDNFDGSGGQSTPVETYADWMAGLHLHDSCVGRGFFLSGNCSGYGDPCTNCNGIRDMDYTRHSHNTPWTAANYGTVWSGCSGGSYFGPCNLEDHCEAGIASQALWDFVNRKLTAAPHFLDQRTAWLLGDRLWYLVIPTLGVDMYTCTVPSSNGCGGASLFTVMRAIDDDGDGTANGTPHAGAIFSAMADHNIACGAAGDPANQNQSSCPTLGAPTVTGEGQNNSALLGWTAVAGAARYAIYRSDIGCDAGLTRIAIINAPTTSYTDTTVVNDIDYYYMVQALGTSDACFGPVSNCEIVRPIPCIIPAVPTALNAAAAGANQISLSWTSSDPGAESFNLYRAIGACPQPSYQLVASDVATTSYLDTTVSGGLTYSYVVTAKDITGGCESATSNCAQAQTTGSCVEPPGFAGVQSVTNPGLDTCTLDLAWSQATAYCGGPATYNVYRSDLSGFEPSPANRIAAGVIGTSYSDASDIQAGATYYYVVRAVDGANGVEDANLEELASSPTGPSSVRFSDSFEGGNQGWTFTFGSPAASTGTFLIGDPVATSGNYGDPSQPGDDHSPSGVNCLYSDENPGGDAGIDDIDNGEVIATSPAFDGSGTAVLEIDLWRWFFNEDDDDSGDYYILDVSNNGGGSWSQVETIPGTVTGTNSWTNVVADLAQIVTPSATMKFRVRAADGQAVGDLVELAIDDIVITGSQMCTPSTLPLPGSFSKTSPVNGATGEPFDLTLTWGSSTGATSYEYCIDTTANGACDGSWTTAGAGTSAFITGLDPETTYSWQVRAVNGQGSTEANSGTWWAFTTESMPLPGTFGKVAPVDGATGQLTDLTLSWGASTAATSYQYCVDTTDNSACDASWITVGLVTSTQVTGLAEWTPYFWQVRAVNGQGSTDADGGSWWWFITTPYLFFDGFESGDLSLWTATQP